MERRDVRYLWTSILGILCIAGLLTLSWFNGETLDEEALEAEITKRIGETVDLEEIDEELIELIEDVLNIEIEEPPEEAANEPPSLRTLLDELSDEYKEHYTVNLWTLNTISDKTADLDVSQGLYSFLFFAYFVLCLLALAILVLGVITFFVKREKAGLVALIGSLTFIGTIILIIITALNLKTKGLTADFTVVPFVLLVVTIAYLSFSAYNLSEKAGIITTRTLIYIVLVALVVICVVPIWVVLVNATRNNGQIMSGLSVIPSVHFRNNWNIVMSKGVNLTQGYINSAIITGSVTVLSVYFSMLAAYAIEIYNFKMKHFIYSMVMILIMIPGQVSVIGFVEYVNRLGLMNSYIPLIVPAIAAPGAVFFFKQYLESCVIHELIQSARIDGCSELGIFHRIMLPIASPGAFTMAIFTFVGSWNNLFLPYMIINEKERFTIPILVKEFRGNPYRVEYGAVYLGIAVTILPVIVVYCFLSRFIVNGIAMGAVKE